MRVERVLAPVPVPVQQVREAAQAKVQVQEEVERVVVEGHEGWALGQRWRW